jgi:hypothetical protein
VLLAAALAAPLSTGCRRTVVVNDDTTYRQWEQDTHREHRDPSQRTNAEKQEYRDWRAAHEHAR